jgi:hypothetical protein
MINLMERETMKKSILTCMVVLAITVPFAGEAHAGVLTSHLSFDGLIDVLDDDSVSLIVDNDSDSAISVGDYIIGVLRIGSTTKSGVLSNTDQLIGYFGFTVTASTNLAGPLVRVLSSSGINPAAGSGWSIDELFSTSLGATAGAAILSKDPEATDITSLAFAPAITALAGYSVEAILGFSTNNAFGDADYLEIQASSDANDNGKIDFSELPPESATGAFIAQEAGGLTVMSHVMGSNIFFGAINSTHLDNSTQTSHQVGISGTISGRRSGTPAGWTLTDSTAFALNATPEPTSMLIWGVIIGTGVVAGRRRKRKTAA